MVPAAVVDPDAGDRSCRCSSADDIVIDGGNSYYHDDIRRAAELKPHGHPLRGRRDQRRRLGARARLLPDDRRRDGRRPAPRPDLRHPRAGHRRGAAHAGPGAGAAAPPSRATCTAGRSGAGHFVKMVHNGIEYGLMAAYAEGLNILRHANAGKQRSASRRRDHAAARPRALPVRPGPGRDRRGLAPRQRDRLVAARPDRRRALDEPRPGGIRGPGLGLRRGPLDARGGHRRGACRRRCSARRCSSASARAARPTSPTGCSPPCATSSAATTRRRPQAPRWEAPR